MVPYKITWFRRGWVGLSQLIWAIVVPIPGHLDVYSWSGGHCGGIIEADIRQGSAKDARQTCKAAYSRFRQFYRQFYRHRLSFTDTRMAFAGCLSDFTDTECGCFLCWLLIVWFWVLFLLLSTLLRARWPTYRPNNRALRRHTHLSPLQ